MDEEDEKEKQKEQDADVMAVVLGVTFGKTSLECKLGVLRLRMKTLRLCSSIEWLIFAYSSIPELKTES